MGKKLVLVGGGGHCKSILDCVIENGCYEQILIVDKREKVGGNVLGIPVIGDDSFLTQISKEEYDVFPAIGSVGDATLRKKISEKLVQEGFHIPNIIAKSANVSIYAKLGKGIFVGKQAVINAEAVIHDFCIINTAALIEHDCNLQEYVHIAPGAVLLGNVRVKKMSHIGAGSIVRQDILVGEHVLIGAGSVVVKDIDSHKKAYGNPCRVREE